MARPVAVTLGDDRREERVALVDRVLLDDGGHGCEFRRFRNDHTCCLISKTLARFAGQSVLTLTKYQTGNTAGHNAATPGAENAGRSQRTGNVVERVAFAAQLGGDQRGHRERRRHANARSGDVRKAAQSGRIAGRLRDHQDIVGGHRETEHGGIPIRCDHFAERILALGFVVVLQLGEAHVGRSRWAVAMCWS